MCFPVRFRHLRSMEFPYCAFSSKVKTLSCLHRRHSRLSHPARHHRCLTCVKASPPPPVPIPCSPPPPPPIPGIICVSTPAPPPPQPCIVCKTAPARPPPVACPQPPLPPIIPFVPTLILLPPLPPLFPILPPPSPSTTPSPVQMLPPPTPVLPLPPPYAPLPPPLSSSLPSFSVISTTTTAWWLGFTATSSFRRRCSGNHGLTSYSPFRWRGSGITTGSSISADSTPTGSRLSADFASAGSRLPSDFLNTTDRTRSTDSSNILHTTSPGRFYTANSRLYHAARGHESMATAGTTAGYLLSNDTGKSISKPGHGFKSAVGSAPSTLLGFTTI